MPQSKLIVFIKCSGDNARFDNLYDTIESFHRTNKDVDYKFYVVVDPHLHSPTFNIFRKLSIENKILEIKATTNSWAVDFNEFLEIYKDSAEWLLISHDDVIFLTDNYFTKLIEPLLEHQDKLGFITSTSEYYYKHEGKMVTDTMRAGFYKDCANWGAMFQLHNRDLNNIDYPNAPVKIHGPMSAIMLIPMESMKKVGACEDWTRYTMLIDEDWCLSALKHNLWNVWNPHVHHLHPNRRGQRISNNKWENEAHAAFIAKWGFDVGNAKAKGWPHGVSIPIEELREMYKDTNIPWSSYRNSYDWEYLDND
tara:strand:- start:16513 stop:17439 length:927 start_codon:yes stop_codon:yes gene_type:complete